MRDQQRARVYAAERASLWKLPQQRFDSLEEVQAYVERMRRQRWYLERFGGKRIAVEKGRERTAARGNSFGIRLPSWSWFEAVILHECAHTLTWQHVAHGPEFVGVYRLLVKEQMGDEASKAFGDALYDHNVDSTPPPKPDPDRARMLITRRREAVRKQRQDAARPPYTSERVSAAATIRRAVKAGEFGPAGSKPRARALAVARTLER